MKNNIASTIIAIGLMIGLSILLFGQPEDSEDQVGAPPAQNVEIRDGVQYVTVNARGGYSPNVSKAKAGIPTKLIMKTNGTYDCSSSLVIRSIGYQNILPASGEEIIDLGTTEAGTLEGLCSMGMYNFAVDFE